MRQFLTFFHYGFVRSKYMIAVSVGLGVLLCFLLGAFSKITGSYNTMCLYVIDHDKSVLSQMLCNYLSEDIRLQLVTGSDFEEGSYGVIDRKYSAVMEIPDYFEKSCIEEKKVPKVTITTVDDYENRAFLEGYLNSYLQAVQLITANSGCDEEQFHSQLADMKKQAKAISTIAMDEELKTEMSQKRGFELSVGFFMNFSLVYGIVIALMIYEDKQEGLLRRVKATPANAMQYILGIMGYIGMLGVVTIAVLLAYVRLTHWSIAVSFATITYCLLVYLVIVLSVSVMLALIIKTRVALIFSVYGIGAVSTMVGGAYFETTMASETMQAVSKLVPQYWVMDYVRHAGNSLEAGGKNMVILALYAALLVLISAIVYNERVGDHIAS